MKAAIEKQAVDNWISWSAYNANAYHAIIPPPAIHALLPLFTANAHSTAMLCHSMDITKEAAQCLNMSRYLPVLTLIADQPLFATLREIQWTFSRPPVKMQSKQKNQLDALKSECGLFSRMYISCQTRHGDLDEFFSHENHAVQPALSTGGKLRVGVKSDLLHCLESSHSEYRHLRIRLRHTPFSKLFRRDKKLIQIFNNAILKLRLTHNKLLLFLAFNK